MADLVVKLKIKLQWIAISADHWNFISRHGPHACPFLHHCFHDSSVKVLRSHWLADPRDWSTKTSSSIRACELLVICLWPAYCSLLIAYCLLLTSWADMINVIRLLQQKNVNFAFDHIDQFVFTLSSFDFCGAWTHHLILIILRKHLIQQLNSTYFECKIRHKTKNVWFMCLSSYNPSIIVEYLG